MEIVMMLSTRHIRRWGGIVASIALVCLSLTGCGEAMEDSPDGEQTPIEVRGTYETQFDTTETITESSWQDADIVDWENDTNWAITHNPDDAEHNPDTYAKIAWTEPDAEGVFYYCSVAFGLETAEKARTTDKTADDSNPEEGGCGNFPWTKMTPTGG